MNIRIVYGLPPEAISIRKRVFVQEQGFQDESDAIDGQAAHVLLYDDHTAVAVCRVYQTHQYWIVGRFAVLKEYRNRHLGSALMDAAQEHVKEKGGKQLRLHAQCQAAPFYEKLGFVPFGDMDYEEGCPHIWMQKNI